MWDACSMHICVWVYVIMWLDSKTIQDAWKSLDCACHDIFCVDEHPCQDPWRPTWFHDVSWFHARNRTCHTAFWNRRPLRFAFCWSTLEPEGSLGRGASRIQEFLASRCSVFTLKVCDEFKGTKTIHLPVCDLSGRKRLVPSPCLPRCLVSSCFPRAVARRLRFKWAQVKLELERWTKKQDSLEWSENHERCFPTANTISEEAYANRTGMFPSRLSNDSNNSTFRGHSSTHTFPWLQPHDLVFSWKAPRTKTDTEMPSQILRGYETPLWNAARDGPPSPWNGFRSYTSTIGSCLVWRIGSMRSLG